MKDLGSGQIDKRPSLNKITAPNMPLRTVTQNRLENMVICLTMMTNTLQIIADSMKTPFLDAIISTTQAVLKNIQVSFMKLALIKVELSHTLDC
jgi:hypothetical protein